MLCCTAKTISLTRKEKAMRKTSYTLILAGAIALPSLVAASSASAADATAQDGVTRHKEDVHVIPPSEHTLTANVGIFSQYIYRGLTQTNEKPALQGGFDYAHSSGLYAGVWGSNISWFSDLNAGNSASLELDTYFGFKDSFAGDFTYDVGFLRYNYPGSYPALGAGVVKPNTNELYGAIGYKWFTAKYSHAISNIFGVADSEGTSYLDLSANFEVADKLTLGLHAGKQAYKGTAIPGGASNDSLYSYTDYKISLTKEWAGANWGIAFTDTNAKDAGYTILGKNVGRSQTVVSVSKTF